LRSGILATGQRPVRAALMIHQESISIAFMPTGAVAVDAGGATDNNGLEMQMAGRTDRVIG
jgi:hypothetical protein